MKQTLSGLVRSYRRYCKCDKTQYLHWLATSLVIGFIFSFNLWGINSFNAMIGFGNWIKFSIYVFLALFSLDFGIRLGAVAFGYAPKYSNWKLGLFFSIFLVFVTNGGLFILSPGGFHFKPVEGLQIGKFKKGFVRKDMSYIIFLGFFFLVLYTALIKKFFPSIATEAIPVAFFIAFWSLFPYDLVLKYFIKECPISNFSYLVASTNSLFSFFTIIFLLLSFALISIPNFGGFITIFISIFIALIVFIVSYIYGYDPQKSLLNKLLQSHKK